jgi:hypothetical protein
VPGTFNSGLADTTVLRLVYDKVHSALYAATPSGLFRSLDQAASWTPLPGLPYPPTPWMAVAPDGSRLLVASAGGIWELGQDTVNDPPAALDDSVSTPELTPATIDVLANDSDPEGDLLVVTGHTAAAHGSVSCGAASCTYAPDLGFQGSDSFTYTVEDGLGAADTATVSVTVTPSPGFDFHTVAPCRMVDTRAGNPLSSGVAQTLALAGLCGVPATAKAVSINLTAVSPTGGGRIVLYPGGAPVPPTSALNFVAGVNRSNNAIVVLAPSGAGTIGILAVFGGGAGQVHATIDVNGYYE